LRLHPSCSTAKKVQGLRKVWKTWGPIEYNMIGIIFPLYRAAFVPFPFRLIYYYQSSKSTGKRKMAKRTSVHCTYRKMVKVSDKSWEVWGGGGITPHCPYPSRFQRPSKVVLLWFIAMYFLHESALFWRHLVLTNLFLKFCAHYGVLRCTSLAFPKWFEACLCNKFVVLLIWDPCKNCTPFLYYFGDFFLVNLGWNGVSRRRRREYTQSGLIRNGSISKQH
jgi:hypothetical protein